jgi:hypothetical protein
MIKQILILLAIAGSANLTMAQQKKTKTGDHTDKSNLSYNDSTQQKNDGPKPYADIIGKDAKTQRGLFIIHTLKNKYYFEIPDSLLNRDILVVNRISKAAAGIRVQTLGYAGDEIGENVVRFEKGPDNHLFLRSVSYTERSQDSTQSGMYRSVSNSNLQPIVANFPIAAYSGNSSMSGSVIDVTDFLNKENGIFYFQPPLINLLKLGIQQNDLSYIGSIQSFPDNIEISAIKSYQKVAAPSAPGAPSSVPDNIPATFELNSSMVLLPKEPMQSRYADARVGYFAAQYLDFDADPQGVKQEAVITRWRLEPKIGEEDKYLRGELVEPRKPIIYYIDPATPRKWVPYLIQGVNDWQVAFEEAGFKNAIRAEVAPTDSSWSIDDARHNVIVYKPSVVANASGPHVHDPRSGEILESHINWYHNIMQLLHSWYMIQAGAIDPGARKMEFDDTLMGELIRFVSSHEVGHTLGLLHNFGASSTVPVEKLRDKNFLEKYGHTPSIMDYARFNFVAQPEDSIGHSGIFPRIGDYDRWAIKWGYQWLPQYKTPKEEATYLNKQVIDSITRNKRLWFGTEADFFDPRTQNEDLGDNEMKAGVYGIKNLQRILPQLPTWTRQPNEGYDALSEMQKQVVAQFQSYMEHVAKIVGGRYRTPKSVEESGPVYALVPKSQQKEAISFLNEQLFQTPHWLLDDSIASKTGINMINTIRTVDWSIFQRIIGPVVVNQLTQQSASGDSVYTTRELFNDLQKGIWTEIYNHTPTDIYRRNLQKMYVEQLIALLDKNTIIAITQLGGIVFGNAVTPPAQTDVSSYVLESLKSLQKEVRKASKKCDGIDRNHYEAVLKRLKEVL